MIRETSRGLLFGILFVSFLLCACVITGLVASLANAPPRSAVLLSNADGLTSMVCPLLALGFLGMVGMLIWMLASSGRGSGRRRR